MRFKLAALICSGLLAHSASGQIKAASLNRIGGFDYKLDSGARSANATYAYNALGSEAWLFGIHGQASVPDSWENAFKRSPNAELAMIANVTWNKGLTDYFVTGTFGGKGEDREWRLDAMSPIQTSYDVNAQVRVTFGVVPLRLSNPFSAALTVGVTRSSNLSDLKEVEVDGKKIREGTLEESTVFPTTLRLNFRLGENLGNSIVRKLPGFDAKKRFNLVSGLYFTGEPRQHGKPTHAAGLTLSLHELVEIELKDEDVPAPLRGIVKDSDVSYWKPTYTVYGEMQQPFGSGKQQTKGGVAVTFTWP